MVEKFEFVGTITIAGRDKERVVNILRQFDPASGFQYFLEEDGEISPFDNAFKDYCVAPYPFMLDRWMDMDVWAYVRSVDLKVYHIEDDDWDAEIGGQKIRVWCEKALEYYESEEDLGCWREYWGLLKDERETLYYFFEKFFREKTNISQKEWWKVWEFRRIILNVSLGEYREKLIDSFIERLSYVLDRGLEEPKNKAKGLLVWIKEHNADMRDFLNGLYEWDYLTADEREEMADAIYERLAELAEKEEDWAGLSLEEWLDLLRKKLIKEKVIKDTDAAFWKWIKRYLERREVFFFGKQDMYDLLRWAFEDNVDWYWMPREEKRELASALEEYIIEKLEEEKSTA